MREKHGLVADHRLLTPKVIEEVAGAVERSQKVEDGHLIRAFPAVFRDDLISRNVYFTASYAINLQRERSQNVTLFV